MRIRRIAAATLALLVIVMGGAMRPAQAAPGDRITRLSVTYEAVLEQAPKLQQPA
ncbi:hypothetical protein [Luteococcus japonicus]|uniref:Uncharacterized protein n=1 Tax=Luteococcus japonicus LSP_Lj1 TaxID=1255658 RepID=A0A1R4JAT7_9ACTN|nr:hypothetical protein [Luteococcus japonicus]SJN29146.1 hypothetical protein FM114_06480 [Luteococcus japonicus LSP_Lj1]